MKILIGVVLMIVYSFVPVYMLGELLPRDLFVHWYAIPVLVWLSAGWFAGLVVGGRILLNLEKETD